MLNSAHTVISFQGYIQDFRLVAGRDAHLLQCPQADTVCPNCGEFRELQDTVKQMQEIYINEIRELKAKVMGKVGQFRRQSAVQ